MRISRRQLAASLLATPRFAERTVIADFVAADTTDFAPNSFPHTSAGVVRYVWTQRGSEFRPLGVMAVGLQDLLMALCGMDADEPVTQEILRAGPHTANVFHHGDGVSIIGAVLYGRPGVALPSPSKRGSARTVSGRRSRTPQMNGQLDLFGMVGL